MIQSTHLQHERQSRSAQSHYTSKLSGLTGRHATKFLSRRQSNSAKIPGEERGLWSSGHFYKIQARQGIKSTRKYIEILRSTRRQETRGTLAADEPHTYMNVHHWLKYSYILYTTLVMLQSCDDSSRLQVTSSRKSNGHEMSGRGKKMWSAVNEIFLFVLMPREPRQYKVATKI